MTEKEAINGKRRARKLVLQALYQWQMSGTEMYEIEAQFRVANNMDKVDGAYFAQLVHNIPKSIREVETIFIPYLDRDIHSLNPIELAVLRLGTYELAHCPDLPYKVILDEAISLTKTFGSQDGHKYVNGVLHQVAQNIRSVEINLGLA
jgi:N utilization substance protein B